MNRRIGQTGLPARFVLTLWGAAFVAGGAGFGLKLLIPGAHRILMAAMVLGTFGLLYFLLTSVSGIPEAASLLRRVRGGRR